MGRPMVFRFGCLMGCQVGCVGGPGCGGRGGRPRPGAASPPCPGEGATPPRPGLFRGVHAAHGGAAPRLGSPAARVRGRPGALRPPSVRRVDRGVDPPGVVARNPRTYTACPVMHPLDHRSPRKVSVCPSPGPGVPSGQNHAKRRAGSRETATQGVWRGSAKGTCTCTAMQSDAASIPEFSHPPEMKHAPSRDRRPSP